MWEQELTMRLEGQIVVLEPLEARHEEGLFTAARHPEIWEWLAPIGDSREIFAAWFAASLAESRMGREGVFATIDRASGEPIGSTRYLNVREAHRGVEIGWTWLTPSMWRTGANVEAKLLMLEHAFERLRCMRVEFKTDARNERSRAAIETLPARFEGIFRKHMRVPGVGVRGSAYYSVIDQEWPLVRANLAGRLLAGASARAQSASSCASVAVRPRSGAVWTSSVGAGRAAAQCVAGVVEGVVDPRQCSRAGIVLDRSRASSARCRGPASARSAGTAGPRAGRAGAAGIRRPSPPSRWPTRGRSRARASSRCSAAA